MEARQDLLVVDRLKTQFFTYGGVVEALDEVSFDAPDLGGKHLAIDEQFVRERLGELARDEDLSRYIL